MPTPVFCCGFECGRFGADGFTAVHHGWSAGAGAPTVETTTVRNGARALRCTPSASATGDYVLITSAAPANGFKLSSQVVVFRFFVRFVTLPSTNVFLCLIGDNVGFGGNNMGVFFDQSVSKLYSTNVVSAIGATGIDVTTGIWYRVDVRVNASANPWTCDVEVDGTSSGQVTLALAAANQVAILMGFAPVSGAFSADGIFDDTVITNTAGDYPYGDGFVNHFVPTADGTHNVAGANDFERGDTGTDITNATTTAFQLIDEVPLDDTTPDTNDSINAIAPPNATDYVEIVFGPASGISTPTVGPRAVEVIVEHHQESTASGNIRLALNDNGSLDDTLNLTAAGVTTTRCGRKHYTDPPSAASAWNANGDGSDGDFRDLRMRFFSSDAAPNQYWDAAMIEAEFAPLVGRTTKNTRAWELGMELGNNMWGQL